MQWEAVVLLVVFAISAITYLCAIFGGGLDLRIEPGGAFIFLCMTGFEVWLVLRLAGVV